MKLLLILVLLSFNLHAQESMTNGDKVFWSSVATLGATETADFITTIKCSHDPLQCGTETNPLGVKGVLIGKAVGVPLVIVLERIGIKHYHRIEKFVTIMNFGFSIEIGNAAGHNAALLRK